MTRSSPEETQQNKSRGLYAKAGPSLSPGDTQNERHQVSSQEQRRGVKNIRMTESITSAAEPSPVHSTVSEQWLHCGHKTQL